MKSKRPCKPSSLPRPCSLASSRPRDSRRTRWFVGFTALVFSVASLAFASASAFAGEQLLPRTRCGVEVAIDVSTATVGGVYGNFLPPASMNRLLALAHCAHDLEAVSDTDDLLVVKLRGLVATQATTTSAALELARVQTLRGDSYQELVKNAGPGLMQILGWMGIGALAAGAIAAVIVVFAPQVHL